MATEQIPPVQQDIKTVITKYAFKARNTDELSFEKNDMIVLTQAPSDGGWWEGTLDMKTGWFPANYVESMPVKLDSTPSTQSSSSQQCTEMRKHRDTILETLIESEQTFIGDLDTFLTHTIQPLSLALVGTDKGSLPFNLSRLEELIQVHRQLIHSLRDSINNTQHRVGNIFLQLAPTLRPIMEAYSYQHAKVLFFLAHSRDRILAVLTKLDPSSNVNGMCLHLVRMLSLPVNRLEKYAGLLNEYLHNLEEFHPDRGDAQRAAEYYGELASQAAAWRRRKEWELDIVHSTIHGLASESLAALGEAHCLCPVNVISENGFQTYERLALLYSSTLILLSSLPSTSITSPVQEYKLENRFLIHQLTLSKIDDEILGKRALKINAPPNQSLIISFPSPFEFHEWCEKFVWLLSKYQQHHHHSQPYPTSYSPPQPPYTPQSTAKAATTSLSTKLTSAGSSPVSLKIPLRSPTPTSGTAIGQTKTGPPPPWSKTCLRPHSPSRPRYGGYSFVAPQSTSGGSVGSNETGLNESGTNRTLKRFMTMKKSKANEFLKRVETSEGDSLLLSVIEAYCTASSGGTNSAMNKLRHSLSTAGAAGVHEHSTTTLAQHDYSSALPLPPPSSSPHIPATTSHYQPEKADDAKMVIYSDALNELRSMLKLLQQDLDEEKRARRQLESQIQRLLLHA